MDIAFVQQLDDVRDPSLISQRPTWRGNLPKYVNEYIRKALYILFEGLLLYILMFTALSIALKRVYMMAACTAWKKKKHKSAHITVDRRT